MPQRARGTSIRPLARLLDASPQPVWIFDPSGALVYLSSACGDWLGIPAEKLRGRSARRSEPSATPSAKHDADEERTLDLFVQSLAHPPGLLQRRYTIHPVQPPALRPIGAGEPTTSSPPAEPRSTLFVALDDSETPTVIAFAGGFQDQPPSPETGAALLIRQVLDRWRALQPSLQELPVAMGTSRHAERLRAQVRLAASTHEHVVLVGEPGCGSQRIAATIHADANRQSDSPPPPLATVEGALMDAELLDATIGPAIDWLAESKSRRAGLLVTEIDQMPADAQSRLNEWIDRFAPRLRLLALSSVDTRSTGPSPPSGQRPLQAGLAAKLDILSIDVPALRQRSEDIPLIAMALLGRRRAAGEGRAEQFSRGATDALVLYPWPKHFEELDAAVRQAIRTCRGSSIQPEHLPLSVRSYQPPDPSVRARQAPIDLDQTLRNVERQLIQRALEQADGNRAEAARRLNISRARLLRRLSELEGD